MRIAFFASLAFVLFACSSSDPTPTTSPTSDGGTTSTEAVCGFSTTDAIKATSVTKEASSGATCPDITTDSLNSSISAEPDGGSDAGDDGCNPVVNQSTCTVTLDCESTAGDGTKSSEKGSFTAQGSQLTGSFVVTVTPPTGAALQCTYDVTFVKK